MARVRCFPTVADDGGNPVNNSSKHSTDVSQMRRECACRNLVCESEQGFSMGTLKTSGGQWCRDDSRTSLIEEPWLMATKTKAAKSTTAPKTTAKRSTKAKACATPKTGAGCAPKAKAAAKPKTAAPRSTKAKATATPKPAKAAARSTKAKPAAAKAPAKRAKTTTN